MKLKKNPKVDLQNKKGLFLEIGLIISIVLVIVAFSSSQKELSIELIDYGDTGVETEMAEVTKQEEQKPTEPVKQTLQVITDILNVVKNDTKITTTFDFAEFDEGEIDVQAIEVETEEVEEDAPFFHAEQMPTFQGGDITKFRSWVFGNLKYPVIAQENGVEGRVVLTFVVERDGSVSNIKVVQSPDRSLSEEAVRVVSSSPKWVPGKQRNNPVRITYTLPVEFTIKR